MPATNKLYFLATLLVFLTAYLAYSPGLSGDFEFDDSINILENEKLRIQSLSLSDIQQAAFSGVAGPLKRPISMLSFAINFYLTGTNPYYFKFTNLMIHLLTGAAILFFCVLLLSAHFKKIQATLQKRYIHWSALLITSIWLLHPINLTSVLYIVQRMTSLSALLTIVSLCLYILGRQHLESNKSKSFTYFVFALICAGLSALCKETGALAPLYMLAIEFFIFRFRTNTMGARKLLFLFFILFAIVPTILIIFTLLVNPDWLSTRYQTRHFDLSQRLLTESRILWFYISLIILPSSSRMGLYHDDITLSTSLLSPPTTLISIVGLCTLAITAIITNKRNPILAFGISWFMIGHILESTILPLELAHEHRNYIPSLGIAMIIGYVLANPFTLKKIRTIRYLSGIVLIALLSISTAIRASQWGNLVDHAAIEVKYHPNSFRANYQMGRIYYMLHANNPDNLHLDMARKYFTKSMQLSTNDIGPLFAILQIDLLEKKDISENTFKELLHHLKNKKVASNTLNYLTTLRNCQSSGACNLTHEKMIKLYDAYAENPYITSITINLIKTQYALYLAENVGDLNSAYLLFKHIVENDENNVQYRINLISLLTLASKFEEAAIELSKAETADKIRIFRNQLNHLRTRIENKDNTTATIY